MDRIIVYEANEVPERVLRWYARAHPNSAIATLLDRGGFASTVNSDELVDRELYPSQTWATAATGVPYDKHGIYWYADPKPVDLPLYWQSAARYRSVGVVGTLHSSPLSASAGLENLKFCVPDIFADSSETIPAHLEGVQRFSMTMANQNARSVGSRWPILGYLRGLAGVLRAGVSPSTLARLGSIAVAVASKRIPKERLRTAHAVLMFDVFERQVKQHDTDLAVFFSNHVAAAMHRFWFASFPDDWADELYDRAWVERNLGELPAAVSELDRQLGRLLRICERTGRRLVVISSMGQHGGEPLRDKSDRVFVVRQPAPFLAAIGVPPEAKERAAMVPQLSAEYVSSDAAVVDKSRIEAAFPQLLVDCAGPVVTITYDLPVNEDGRVQLGSEMVDPASIGGEAIEVEEHRNGMHHPIGVLLSSAPFAENPGDTPVDTLALAPALLAALSVPLEPHHIAPQLVL